MTVLQPTTSTVEVTSSASMEHEVRNELNTSSPMTQPEKAEPMGKHTAAPTWTGRKALKTAADNPLGINEWVGPRTFGLVQWRKMHERLCRDGLMRPYPHGIAYEITEAGRAALTKQSQDRPHEG